MTFLSPVVVAPTWLSSATVSVGEAIIPEKEAPIILRLESSYYFEVILRTSCALKERHLNVYLVLRIES
jgi:hypothetical protein